MAVCCIKKESCCGCKACQDICPVNAILFEIDEEGFWYPNVNKKKCIECKKCERICPQLKQIKKVEPIQVYAARNKDKDIVNKSSSGGIFTALATAVLERKGHVYCVEYDYNIVARFKCIDTLEGLDSCRGSKYVQADTEGIFKHILEDLSKGIFVMFVGTPCQAAAVREITKNNKENILIVDFICHGVPSPMIFKDFIEYLQKRNKSKVIKYNNRCKAEGWKQLEEVTFENGKVDHVSSLSQAWHNIFFTHNCLRPSCTECRYNHYEKREADITIADFWGIEKYHKDFSDINGNSIVVLYTFNGVNWFERISESVISIPSKLEYCLELQPHFKGEGAVAASREEFWEDYKKKDMNYITKKYGKCALKLRVKKYIKRKIGRI